MQSEDDKQYQGTTHINIPDEERLLSLVGGAACIGYGLLRGKLDGLAVALVGGGLVIRGATGRSMVYDKAGVNRAVSGTSRQVSVPHEQGIKVEKTFTINRPAEELYQFWRNFENLPRFMKHLESVTVQDSTHSHWVAKGPAGTKVEWDAEIINEIPNQVIGWRSLQNADIDNAGSVRFRPATGGRGTLVDVTVNYLPPAGKVGAIIARLFGEEPKQQITDDLRRFKSLMEAGEVPTTDGQPSGRKKENEKGGKERHESTVLARH